MRKSALQSVLHVFLMTIAVCCFLLSTCFALPPAKDAQLKPALSSLQYFTGDWGCSGKFDASGKSIDAHQHFAPELDGSWISFRHEDKPPFGYRSLAELGWDAESKNFVMIVQDSTGGARVFRSTGWNAAQLQWTGDALGSASAPGQQFTFERLDDRHYRVSYFVRKKADWSRVDSSLCSKQ